MTIDIKKASANDIPVILSLAYELGRPKPRRDSDVDDFRAVVRRYIGDADKQILIARMDDVEVVGMASIVFADRLNHRSTEMCIHELIVLEGYRSRGIGTRLVESCIAAARRRGCHRVRLESANHRRRSHRFYQSLGFEQSLLSFTKSLDQSGIGRI